MEKREFAKELLSHILNKLRQHHTLLLALVILLTLILSAPQKIKSENILSATDSSQAVSFEDFHLVIPGLKLDAPVIVDVDGSNKEEYFKALENGVAHFKGTAKPGEGSNIFIFGHSSFYKNKPGNYKEIFKNLEQVKAGDEIILWYQKKEFRYQVSEIKVVNPDQVSVLKPTSKEQVSLMTCVPPGTTLKRLIIIALPVGN